MKNLSLQNLQERTKFCARQLILCKKKSIELNIKIHKSGWIIKTVIASNEALFEGGSLIEYPGKSTNEVRLKIFREKNVEESVVLKVLMG